MLIAGNVERNNDCAASGGAPEAAADGAVLVVARPVRDDAISRARMSRKRESIRLPTDPIAPWKGFVSNAFLSRY